jgi:formate hydrogenlyase transcriptional activator
VVCLPVPSLRDRAEDLPLLVRHFVNKYAGRMQEHIDEIPVEAMNALSGHSWPGNTRELQNFIERSVILTSGKTLRPRLEGLGQAAENGSLGAITLEEAKRDHIRKTLKQMKGVVAGSNGAAAGLEMKRSTLLFTCRDWESPSPTRAAGPWRILGVANEFFSADCANLLVFSSRSCFF